MTLTYDTWKRIIRTQLTTQNFTDCLVLLPRFNRIT